MSRIYWKKKMLQGKMGYTSKPRGHLYILSQNKVISCDNKKQKTRAVYFLFLETVFCSQQGEHRKQREHVWFLILFCFEKHKKT